MKVNCKVTVYSDGEVKTIIDCTYCCQRMQEMDREYGIVEYGGEYASLTFSRYDCVYSEEITHYPWCGAKIEYVVTKRVRQVKHETQKVINQVTYTEEEIP